jgi:hypothetical protein
VRTREDADGQVLARLELLERLEERPGVRPVDGAAHLRSVEHHDPHRSFVGHRDSHGGSMPDRCTRR